MGAQNLIVRGEGYSDGVKPFGLREDIFVTGCVLADLLREAMDGSWPTVWRQRCIAAIGGLEWCSAQNPSDIRVQFVVAATLSFPDDVIRESGLHCTDTREMARSRWYRDAH